MVYYFGNIDEVPEHEIKSYVFQGKSLPVTGTTVKWLSQVGEATLPEYGLRLFTIKPGGHIPTHQHEYAQTQVIISGELLMAIYNEDGTEIIEERNVRPGDSIYVSPMEVHGMKNVGTEDVTLFCCICVLGDED